MSALIDYFTNPGNTALANSLGIFATLIAAFFSVWNWEIERKRKLFDETLISIALISNEGQSYTLYGKIRRKNLTRAELQGMIGAIPRDNHLYSIAYLYDPEFYTMLERVQSTPNETIINIQCTAEEIAQFNFE